MDKIPLTVDGYKKLEEELKHRKSVDRPRIKDDLNEARAHGDLKENAEYHAAREEQAFNEGRIQELEGVISLAEVIDVQKIAGDTVKFGATVTVYDVDTEAEKTYKIVGEPEADINNNLVSIASPIAKALIGKGQEDEVRVQTPGGFKSYEVVSVEYK